MRVTAQGTRQEMQHLQDLLKQWLEECTSLPERDDDRELETYSGLLAFYPRVNDTEQA